MPTISFEELTKLISKFDVELEKEGIPVIGRPLHMMGKLSDHFKCRISSDDEIWRITMKICDSLYPRQALVIKPLMTGIFLFKGCLYKASIPLSLGSIRLDLDDIIKDMPDFRREQLCNSWKEYGRYLLCSFELIDLGWGFDQLFHEKKLPPDSLALMKNGKDELESAANSALLSRRFAAAMHSAQVAIELIIKGALVRSGFKEEELIKIRHDHEKMANSFVTTT